MHSLVLRSSWSQTNGLGAQSQFTNILELTNIRDGICTLVDFKTLDGYLKSENYDVRLPFLAPLPNVAHLGSLWVA